MDKTGEVLVVDVANVVGSRPTGWWRDRAGASRTFVTLLREAVDAGRVDRPVIVVLEGKARPGVEVGTFRGVTVVHAAASGDDALVELITHADDPDVTLVTADRGLRSRGEALGASVVGPGWLLDRLAE